jgi:hypothetical protein
MTPDNAASPYVSGSLDFNGFFKDTKDGYLVLKFWSTNLTYSNSCGNFFKDGSLTYIDGAGGKLVFTYSNCSESVTFNGNPVN